jgi:Na+/glutamate symporter
LKKKFTEKNKEEIHKQNLQKKNSQKKNSQKKNSQKKSSQKKFTKDKITKEIYKRKMAEEIYGQILSLNCGFHCNRFCGNLCMWVGSLNSINSALFFC